MDGNLLPFVNHSLFARSLVSYRQTNNSEHSQIVGNGMRAETRAKGPSEDHKGWMDTRPASPSPSQKYLSRPRAVRSLVPSLAFLRKLN